MFLSNVLCDIHKRFFRTAICPKERVRLVGGPPVHQGLVEVCSDGRWGTVQTSQPQQVAKEVCRILNFNEMNEITSVSGKKSKLNHAINHTRAVSNVPSEPANVYNCSIICGSLFCEESKNNSDLLSISCLTGKRIFKMHVYKCVLNRPGKL